MRKMRKIKQNLSHADDRGARYMPSESEIAAGAAAIRFAWSDRERERRVVARDAVDWWEPPVIHVATDWLTCCRGRADGLEVIDDGRNEMEEV